MRKTFGMIGIYIATIIGLISIIVFLFLKLSPQFGKGVTKEQKREYSKLANYENGKFANINPTKMDIHFLDLIAKMLKRAPNRKPLKNIHTKNVNTSTFDKQDLSKTKLIWIGHSTFLLKMEGKIILIDPMFGETPSPLSMVGTKRYSKELPIEIEKIQFIDAVILSHDHYDHLDYESIKKLKGKVGKYFTPLGVGNHLIEWGIEKEKINELNWWESIEFENINLICTPSRHFSGRGLFDRATTLWCSWVIKGEKDNIYFSGDSGYDTHFKEIGDKYGPFDISLVECGQYHQDWKLFHMMPEETVQASIDLNSKLVMPIHWGAFTLALHDWTDPIERITKRANELNLPVATPKIGETVIVGSPIFPTTKWWLDYTL
ncbi:MAG: MBL fold metallo-hydrolase [Draconibacterium sp.]|nr:MBL fold metallo-hydrolase [Draconibacterium sp.]